MIHKFDYKTKKWYKIEKNSPTGIRTQTPENAAPSALPAELQCQSGVAAKSRNESIYQCFTIDKCAIWR